MKFFSFFFLFLALNGFSQKKIIDHTDYNDWKTLSKNQLSPSGNFVTYEINPLRGDGYLYLYSSKTNTLDSFYRAKNATFSFDESYLVFTITPGFDTLRKCELDKIDKKKWPKDTIAVYVFATDSLMKFANVKSHTVGQKNNWLTYLENENKIPNEESKSSKKKKKKKKNEKEDKSDGTILRNWNPITNKEFIAKNVTSYTLSEDGEHLAFITHLNDSSSLHIWKMSTDELKNIQKKRVAFSQLTFSKSADQLAFLSSNDTLKVKQFDLHLFQVQNNEWVTIADSTSRIFPEGKSVSENRTLAFSNDEQLLYFGIADKIKAPEKDTLLETEKPKLDVWHYSENRLQPDQLKNLKKDQKQTDLYVYHLKEERMVALSNDTLNVREDLENTSGQILGTSNERYAKAYQWDMSEKEDIYLVDLTTGASKVLKEAVRYYAPLSNKGDQLLTFDYSKNVFQSKNTLTGVEVCLTCGLDSIEWVSDINGMPMDASPVGFFGWSKDGTIVYLRARYDVFSYDFSSSSLKCLTNFEGSKKKIEFTPKIWDRDSAFVELENVYFEGFNTQTKGIHIYEFVNGNLQETLYLDKSISDLQKAKKGVARTLRSMTVSEYPDLQFSANGFDKLTQISTANPTQSEYNWAQVELVKWKSYKGIELEGLLYKPENYDSTKSYPMIVYFYELYSDKLHSYYSPKPTASIVFPTEYASAGYFIFIPDIRYEVGHPANSAYDCIMSGTDHVLKLYSSVDSTRLGLQGQSWGGYQTAQLITMTKRYRAAMAGAPVSNMFSAYGGIRWGTGINRQFQYEKTQSRIGKTIWEAPELYFENSPLFHLPKVETPLLIMHNDADGAVPWYQGIELYNGLRRLEKPCWMLNYNDDDHNLMKNANRIDLSIRMRQFFDYYLNNQPAPLWLVKGIPATKKGEELRYELIEN